MGFNFGVARCLGRKNTRGKRKQVLGARWFVEETIKEIQRLSKLTEEKRKQLGEDLKRAIEQVKFFHFRRPAVRAHFNYLVSKFKFV